MFAARYFAPRFYAPRYFPEVGATPIPPISGGYNFFFAAYAMEDNMKLLDPMAVTPSDIDPNNAQVKNGFQPDHLWVGVSGDVKVVLIDKSTFVYPAVAAGGWHPISLITGIMSTGTTATGINVSRAQ